MRLFTAFLTTTCLLGAVCNNAVAQTFDLHFVVVTNDGANYGVKIQMRASSAFNLGSSNLFFAFNTAALDSPSLQNAWNYSGSNYSAMTITRNPTEVSVNIVLNSPGTGSALPATYTDVATIQFKTTNPAGNSNLVWDGTATAVFKDDELTLVSADSLNNLNTSPLPIELSTFTGSAVSLNEIRLEWSTLSEVNNYGFFVQRHSSKELAFKDLSGSFVPGHGTTVKPFHYSYVDNSPKTDTLYYYRLRQQDQDGTMHYYPGITVSSVDIADLAPKEFHLFQNYPNPFNPSTALKFSVETDGRTTLRVYNILGQVVATLFDEVARAGQYYTVHFNGASLASGVYFFRLQTQSKSDLKKMLLMK